MNDAPRISPQILRGLQLKDLGRYADAERAFKEALAHEPNDAFVLHQLAACQFHQAGLQREALATIDSAIAVEPIPRIITSCEASFSAIWIGPRMRWRPRGLH